MNYDYEAIAEELGDEEIQRRIDDLSTYARTDTLVQVEIPSEEWTPEFLRAFATFADSILSQYAGTELNAMTIRREKPLAELRRHVLNDERWRRQDAERKAAEKDAG